MNMYVERPPLNKPKSEKAVEKYLCEQIEKLGGLCEKFVSPGRRSVPDRVITLEGGVIIFVELKKFPATPTRHQKRDHDRRRKLGCRVEVLSCTFQVDQFIEGLKSAK